jgi:hypothetical protein
MMTWSAMQRTARSRLATAMLLMLLGTSVPVVAHADDGGGVYRWWGAVGAVMCGAEISLARTIPAVGMQPALIAAGLGGCILALMDVCSSA